jgi:hypothetical protein
MLGRSLASAALLVLLAGGVASAAPVSVNLRVEGATSTIFEGPVTTDGKTIDKGDGPHPCDGTNGGANPSPGPTMTSALDDAAGSGVFDWSGTWFSFGDFGIDRIGPDAADPAAGQFGAYWGYALNLVPSQVGGCQQRVNRADEVLFGYDFFSKGHLLRLAGPVRAAVGAPVTVVVTDGQSAPEPTVQGAIVSGGGTQATTGPDGRATLAFDTPGVKRLKAERADSLRSAALEVCVPGPGVDCAAVAAGGGLGVRDSRAPAARVSGPRDGARYGRGPRVLRGTAGDDQGVTQVKLALRRHVAGRNCRWWSGRRERFVGTHCHKAFFFLIGDDADWSYLLPRRLPPGRYVLDVKAFDRARNRDERFVRGRNRVVFDVAPPPAGGGGAHRGPGARAARARGARVQVLVAGRDGLIAGPLAIRARAAVVRAGGRRCAVGASTPLAALAATLRGSAGAGIGARRPGYHLRDFGRCSGRTAVGSGQLFVDRIRGERNRGRDGWIYKVDDRAGTAGAADPAGPFGRGRLHPGDRVVWLYCRFDEASGSCQRSLRIVPDRSAVAVGEPLAVKVIGHDDEGRSRPVAGAVVRLGSASAVTGADGRAALLPAATGRLSLTAQMAGTVPAFPVTVRITGGARPAPAAAGARVR